MDFKLATDELLDNATLRDLAKALGVSTQSIRQARARQGTTAYREPPQGWEKGVETLALDRIRRLKKLIKSLK